jgi:KipI family sensor histidine kinase inhibitor
VTGPPTCRLVPYGEAALLVEVEDLATALRLRAAVTDPGPGDGALVDAVVGARTVLLVGREAAAVPLLRRHATEALARLGPDTGDATASPADVVEVAVTYDGEDLEDVARLTGLSPAEVVAAHTGRPWLVGFAGFAPGFAYLVGGDQRLRVPRRSTPRSRVPAGAVGLADTFSGVYPRESPGGWQLIGRTGAVLWDLERDPPALLLPGRQVRFVDAGRRRG